MRLATLTPYWDFFEDRVHSDLRADRAELTAIVLDALRAEGAEIVLSETVDSIRTGASAGADIAAAAVDAVVVIQSMCVPPAYVMAALDELPKRTPVVVSVVGRHRRFDSEFSHSDIVREGATVGAPQLTNLLARRGRPCDLVVVQVGDRDDAAALAGAARAAAAAGRLSRARIARVGAPIPGYECVDCDPHELQDATGIALVSVEPAAVRDAFLAASDNAVAMVEAEARREFQLMPGINENDCLRRSTRFAAGMEALDASLDVQAGAMNCHVPEIRFADEPGIAPCFALGRETTRGIPWSCSGDVVTAVAMLTLKRLGGAALYHEIEAIDRDRDEALLANSGEHDLAFADPRETPQLRPNTWWPSDNRCSACAMLAPPPGPATLVGFTPHADEPSGFRFVVAEGEFTDRRFPRAGTAHAAFRFAHAPVDQAWGAWARAGVNHHSAATPRHFADSVAQVATHLGVGCVRV